MTTKQMFTAAAILAAAVSWITWPKVFVLVAIIAIVWLSLASVVAVAIGKMAAARDEQR
jgi:hypothetical protein